MTKNRVRVWSGDNKDYLGLGEVVRGVTVYFWRADENRIVSLPDAEKRPSDEEIATMRSAGMELMRYPNNPKIVMDDGHIWYGCQVWWRPMEDDEEDGDVQF